jgi:hypothetical protein
MNIAEVAARAVTYVAAMLMVGASLFVIYAPGGARAPAEEDLRDWRALRRRVRQLQLGCIVATLVAGLLWLVIHSAGVADVPLLQAVSGAAAGEVLRATLFGRAMVRISVSACPGGRWCYRAAGALLGSARRCDPRPLSAAPSRRRSGDGLAPLTGSDRYVFEATLRTCSPLGVAGNVAAFVVLLVGAVEGSRRFSDASATRRILGDRVPCVGRCSTQKSTRGIRRVRRRCCLEPRMASCLC